MKAPGVATMVTAGLVPAVVLGVALGVVAAVAVERLRGAFGDPIEWDGDDDG